MCEHDCIDTTEAYECSCWQGYQLESNSHNCTDEDECLMGTHACSHGCVNTEGSYFCTCPPGYSLGEDNTTCSDIDECETSPCDQECVNTAGSFTCLCRDGYKLQQNQISCSDINECDPESGVNSLCQHSCVNTPGSYYCSCEPGRTVSSDSHHCLEVGECENPTVCPQLCVNTTGDYYCQCHSGYRLSDDGHNCTAKPSLGEGLLVVYMPWVVPLGSASVLLLLAFTIYYSVSRRRKQGNILETNQDLYDFYLTQEKIDCTYQPVDLSNGLPFDSESIHSEVTSYHSASNTAEDLSKLADASDKTQLVLVDRDSSFNGKEKLAASSSGGDGSENSAADLTQSQQQLCKSLGKLTSHDSHDSCVGSSIAGDTSSGFHTSTVLFSPDTSGSSFGNSTDTSANSDYISTGVEDSQSPQLPRRPSHSNQGGAVAGITSALGLPGNSEETQTDSQSERESQARRATESSAVSETQVNRGRKGLAKTKDYIHATNALFSVVDGAPPTSHE
jgi:hypothetical protein